MIDEGFGSRVLELVNVGLDHPRSGGTIVAGANLTVASGEVVVIVGAAGAGTTRLVAAALGEAPPHAGTISVLGHNITKLRRASLRVLRRRIGIVPQELCLLDDRSARDNVCMPLDIDGIPRAVSVARALEVLGYLGLADEAHTPVCELALSARQRVAVARALIRDPELIVADHPTCMQDADGAELVCEALASAARRGAACIVLGRDPALRAIAERSRWRMFALADGALAPIVQTSIDARAVAIGSAPARSPADAMPPLAIRPPAEEDFGSHDAIDADITALDSILVPFPARRAAGGVA